MNRKSFKRRIVRGEVTFGSWIQLAHPANAEIMSAAGFDWLTVDLEHSVITIREAEELIRIIDLSGVVPLVRLSDNDPVEVKRIMDAGAAGVIVPMVNSAEAARNAVGAVRYPPKGYRGVGLARAQGYGARFKEYWDWLEAEAIIIVQIEHIDAVRQLDQILKVEGVDGFMIGPYDLSCSLGIPGQFEHPAVVNALAEIRRISAKYPNIAPGFHVVSPNPALVAAKIDEGFRIIGYSTDMILLGDACRKGVQDLRELPIATGTRRQSRVTGTARQ